MKRIISFLFLLLFSFSLSAQQSAKNDVVLKTSGEELTGKVTEILDDEIRFIYVNETLVYNIKKSDIQKITFASGRIETFGKAASGPAPKAQAAAGTEGHHNKVAILPFGFIRDGQGSADEVSLQVQNYCHDYLSKHAGVLTVLDPRTTNALLAKAGVTKDNVKQYTMDDLCNILGAEYLIEGTVIMNRTTQTNMQSSTYNDKKDKDDKDRKTSGYSYSTSTQNYETTLNLNIYNDTGASIYSQSRKSFFNTQDAYKNTLEYLLKRTPLYSK